MYFDPPAFDNKSLKLALSEKNVLIVARRRQMAMSCGLEKRNLPCSSANDHDDFCDQKINFPICSSENSLWP